MFAKLLNKRLKLFVLTRLIVKNIKVIKAMLSALYLIEADRYHRDSAKSLAKQHTQNLMIIASTKPLPQFKET